MNNVCLVGRNVRNVELKTYGSDGFITKFTLAVDRRFKKDGEPTDFINCIAFGKTAEIIANHVSKGDQLGVTEIGRAHV